MVVRVLGIFLILGTLFAVIRPPGDVIGRGLEHQARHQHDSRVPFARPPIDRLRLVLAEPLFYLGSYYSLNEAVQTRHS